ncbi:MAG TPA: YtxH domain-containing protein [Gemmatimonadales bacterium]|jgi:gas vesicle protein|nr:YtxH domain-containing protein [Gemmatimonadales bacterium]
MRDDGEVTVVETGGSAIKWFLLGTVVGAGLGLLFAPQSGERTRRDLGRHARKLKAQATDKFDELTDDLQDRGKRIKESVEDFVEEVEEGVRDGVRDGRKRVAHEAVSARDELERRLSEARSRRRAAVAADGAADDE